MALAWYIFNVWCNPQSVLFCMRLLHGELPCFREFQQKTAILGNVVDMPSHATFLNDILEQMQGMTLRSLYFGLWMLVVTLKLSFPHVFPESCLDPGMSHVPRFLQAKRSELSKILYIMYIILLGGALQHP